MNCNCLPIHLINIPFNQISEVNDIWNKQIRWGPLRNQYSTQSRDQPLWRGWWRPLSPASSHGGGAWQLSVVSYWVSTQSRHLRTHSHLVTPPSVSLSLQWPQCDVVVVTVTWQQDCPSDVETLSRLSMLVFYAINTQKRKRNACYGALGGLSIVFMA